MSAGTNIDDITVKQKDFNSVTNGNTDNDLDENYPRIEDSRYHDEEDLPLSSACPFCSLIFSGLRENVEEDLFDHIWLKHSEDALDYVLNNMYIPEDLKVEIFERLGPEYISWLIDRNGELG